MSVAKAFSKAELRLLRDNVGALSLDEQTALLSDLDREVKTREQAECRDALLPFMQKIMPHYLIGSHHRRIADVFGAVARGEKLRVIINIAPRHGKSETSSFLFPSWFLGKFPEKKVIMASHTAELAVSFGRRVRNLMATTEYKEVFPGVSLSADNKAAGRWATSSHGEFFATGIGGALAGRGGDVVIVDDPLSEQSVKAAAGSNQLFVDQWEWFQQGLMTRLMPGGACILLMTRWSKLDLTGQIINHMTKNPDADQWEVIELPAVLPSGKPLWPEFWSAKELEQKKLAVGPAAWAAQYLQQPTSEGAQLLKKDWWRHWEKEEPPKCEYTIMSLDAAQESHNRADYNAVTHWGVFYMDGPDGRRQANVILLNAWRERMEFPELKKAILADYNKWEPDTFIVEKKSNGAALYQELRRMGLSVVEFTPGKGQDKISRVNAISDMISSGVVWAPTDRRWAEELIEECAEFPLGEHDDLVDSTTQALIRVRQGGFLTLPTDYEDKELPEYRRKSGKFY